MHRHTVFTLLVLCTAICPVFAQVIPQMKLKTHEYHPTEFVPVTYTPAKQSVTSYQRSSSEVAYNNTTNTGDSWVIREIYEKTEAPKNAKAIGRSSNSIIGDNNVITAEYILIPFNLTPDTYHIKIRQDESGLYEIIGTSLLFELQGNYLSQPCNLLNPTREVLLTKDILTWKIQEIK